VHDLVLAETLATELGGIVMSAILPLVETRPAPRIAGDLSTLPDYNFGPTSLGWWGVVGFMLIEGMGFVLAFGAYFYLIPFEQQWPPAPTAPPPLIWSTAFVVLILLSEVPNLLAARAARQLDLHGVRFWMTTTCVAALVVLLARAFELAALNVTWMETAYGSIVWALLALHTLHTVTDVYDSLVLDVLVFVKPVDGRKFSDVADNAMYWHFIVASAVVLYLIVYWTPRWL
jgi:heme/copper-type cytochrome/quinol oxidase subunit 3